MKMLYSFLTNSAVRFKFKMRFFSIFSRVVFVLFFIYLIALGLAFFMSAAYYVYDNFFIQALDNKHRPLMPITYPLLELQDWYKGTTLFDGGFSGIRRMDLFDVEMCYKNNFRRYPLMLRVYSPYLTVDILAVTEHTIRNPTSGDLTVIPGVYYGDAGSRNLFNSLGDLTFEWSNPESIRKIRKFVYVVYESTPNGVLKISLLSEDQMWKALGNANAFHYYRLSGSGWEPFGVRELHNFPELLRPDGYITNYPYHVKHQYLRGVWGTYSMFQWFSKNDANWLPAYGLLAYYTMPIAFALAYSTMLAEPTLSGVGFNDPEHLMMWLSTADGVGWFGEVQDLNSLYAFSRDGLLAAQVEDGNVKLSWEFRDRFFILEKLNSTYPHKFTLPSPEEMDKMKELGERYQHAIFKTVYTEKAPKGPMYRGPIILSHFDTKFDD